MIAQQDNRRLAVLAVSRPVRAVALLAAVAAAAVIGWSRHRVR